MKKLLLALLLAPAFALAAPTTAKTGKVKTIRPISGAKIDGLSAFGTWDMADSFDFSGNNGRSISGTFSSEKSFGVGAKYFLGQMENGLGFEAGGSFEFGRSISNVKMDGATRQFEQKPEMQFWTMFGNVNAYLTEQFAVYGGANYNFPQVKNLKDADFKGKLGYQFGATYNVAQNFAVDGEYRTINISGSNKAAGDDGVTEVTYNYDNIRAQGLMIRGRYLF